MGVLTLADYQAEVLLVLALDSTEPIIAGGLHTRAINNAPNWLVRRFPHQFPEHQNRSWTIGPTVVGDNKVALPSNLLILREVRSADSSTDPSGWEDTQERVVSRMDISTIGLQDKDSADDQYPRIWDRKGNNLMYAPTTRTGATTYLRLYGISKETPLSLSTDTFTMDADFDTIIVQIAAAEVADKMGYRDVAKELRAGVMEQMGGGLNAVAWGLGDGGAEVDGFPTQSSVYGGN